MKPSDFIAKISAAACAACTASGIPASVTIAQAALESGWGVHTPGNALFGIKATSNWHGATQLLQTTEYVNGKPIRVKAAFRAYPDWDASIADRSAFLRGNPRYAPAFNGKLSAADFARQLQACGYATDPHYADELISLIDQHNLTALDT
jgi:flagellar rod assembly protein/muramidase FlgJ